MGRPIAYHLADPNNVSLGNVTTGERVLAKYIVHGFEKRRPFQSQGEPILAPLVERLQQEEDLVKIELQAARIVSNFAVAITSEFHPDDTDEDTTEPQAVVDISPGTVTRLYPGEKAEAFQSQRPNQLIEAFRRMLRGDLAAAGRCARKWLDRDYASATFMNTRMEQNDSKRMHKPTQNWLGRHIASRPYLEALPWILLKIGQAMPADGPGKKKLSGHKIQPDLPEYVDPLADGQAAIQNVGGGLSTMQDECSSRGKDYAEITKQRTREAIQADAAVVERLAALAATIAEAKKKTPELELDWSQVITLAGATSAPGAYLDAIASAKQTAAQPDQGDNGEPMNPKAKQPAPKESDDE